MWYFGENRDVKLSTLLWYFRVRLYTSTLLIIVDPTTCLGIAAQVDDEGRILKQILENGLVE